VEDPSVTIPVAAASSPSPITLLDYEHGSTAVSHPDAAAVAVGSPGSYSSQRALLNCLRSLTLPVVYVRQYA
jgi:hypothetical protein